MQSRVLRFFACAVAVMAFTAAPAAAHGGLDEPGHIDTVRELNKQDPVVRNARTASIAQAGGLGLDESPFSLPSQWCGSQRFTDHPLNVNAAADPQVKVVYAWPADHPNRFPAAANALQASVSAITKFVAASSGYRKTLRFDLGTDCGPLYADIISVALPGSSASYLDANGQADFDKLSDALDARLPKAAGPRSYMVFADYMSTAPWGMGGMGLYGNHAYAMVFNSDRLDTYFNDGAWYPSLLLHEVTHTMGAVADDAPYSSGAGHCRQDADVMCYDDGGPKVQALGMIRACGTDDLGPVHAPYDCGGEDYFNPAPPAGSWLASNPAANVYYSEFMGPCSRLLSSCTENRYDGPDRDGDQVEDPFDDCPDTAGPITAQGCPDTDGDGYLDNEDDCPTQAGTDGDDCPRLPRPRARTVTVRAGKHKLGRLTVTARPGWSTYRLNGKARLRLAKGRWKVKVCVGTAASPHARKVHHLTCAKLRTYKVRARHGKTITRSVNVQRPAANVPAYVGATVTVKPNKRKDRLRYTRPVLLTPPLP